MSNGQANWIAIPDDLPLPAGSEVNIRCEWQSGNLYARAAQWAIIESNLEKSHPEFEVISYNNGTEDLTIEVRVREVPAATAEVQRAGIITVGIILGLLGVIGMGIFAAWGFRDHQAMLNTQAQTAYAQTTTAKIEAAKWPLIALAALAAVVIFGLVKLK